MKNKKVKLSVLLLLGIGLNELQAQEVIPTTGGNASGSGGSVSYSVGQVVYNTYEGASGTASQGVQLPFEILVVTGIEQTKGITLQCSAFPNPTLDFLYLKVEATAVLSPESMSYQLFDIQGKLLETKNLQETHATISMKKLTQAIYFLSVTADQKVIKTFKIIKN
jgi:hypothetical protein